jgi:hypothetical protein
VTLSRAAAAKAARGLARRAAHGAAPKRQLLRRGCVKKVTLTAYTTAVERFETWARRRRLPLTDLREADLALTLYFSELYLEGERPAAGRYTRYGYLLLRTSCDGDRNGDMPESRRALQGWTSLDPGRTRDPLPDIVVHWIASWFVDQDELEAAFAVMLQYDTYGRPSEILNLMRLDFTEPQPAAGPLFCNDWTVNLANSVDGRNRKNGELDDSVRIGSPGRLWMRDATQLYLKGCRGPGRVFQLKLSHYENLFRSAAAALGLTALKPCPHAVRHSGPSHDTWARTLQLYEVKKRGGWKHDKSVARYEKHAKLLRQLELMSSRAQATALRATRALPLKLTAALRKRSLR